MSRPDGCALVTGATGGIGEAVARALAADGWAVGIGYRSDPDAALALAAELGGTAVPCDLCDVVGIDAAFTALESARGPVLCLVNNAGVTSDGLTMELPDAAWDTVLQTNLTGAFHTTRRALTTMIRARFGRIVNVASVVGTTTGNAGQANYAASKAGLVGMTRCVAREVARRGVTVNAVAPGLIDTEMTAGIDPAVVRGIPARRAGTPADVAHAVAFLASTQAGYVTGTTLTIDGGWTA